MNTRMNWDEELAEAYRTADKARPIKAGDLCIEMLDQYFGGWAVFTAIRDLEGTDYSIRVLRRSGGRP